MIEAHYHWRKTKQKKRQKPKQTECGVVYSELTRLAFDVTCSKLQSYWENISDKKLWVEHTLFLEDLTILCKSSYRCKSRMHICLEFELHCEKCFCMNFDHVTKIKKKQKRRIIEFQTIFFLMDCVKIFDFFSLKSFK